MAGIHRVFDMPLDKHPLFIVDFLPETHCILVHINFFEISSGPASTTYHFVPVTTSTTRKHFPRAKLSLI